MGWRFMRALAKELSEDQEFLLKANNFIIFHMVILQCTWHVTGAQAIWWCSMI